MRLAMLTAMLLAACAGPAAEKQAAGTTAAPATVAAPGPEPAKPADPPAPAVAAPAQEVPGDQRDAKIGEALRQGAAALAARDGDGAVRSARQALDADERNVAAMILLARGYYLKGYDDKVEAVLAIARKQKAGDADPVVWMLLGLVADRGHREDQALAAYEKAVQRKPDYLGALNNLGAIYLGRHRFADAISCFERAVKLEEKSPRAHTNLGSAYRGRSADVTDRKDERDQLLRRAESEYKLAIAHDPSYAPAYFDAGLLYLDADPYPGLESLARYQEAQRYLSRYKQAAGPPVVAAVDEYLAAAEKGIEREQKLLDKKKKKEAVKGDRRP